MQEWATCHRMCSWSSQMGRKKKIKILKWDHPELGWALHPVISVLLRDWKEDTEARVTWSQSQRLEWGCRQPRNAWRPRSYKRQGKKEKWIKIRGKEGSSPRSRQRESPGMSHKGLLVTFWTHQDPTASRSPLMPGIPFRPAFAFLSWFPVQLRSHLFSYPLLASPTLSPASLESPVFIPKVLVHFCDYHPATQWLLSLISLIRLCVFEGRDWLGFLYTLPLAHTYPVCIWRHVPEESGG